MLLNILINLVLNVQNDVQLTREYVSAANGIEEMCFKAIKYSLEIADVPIRKFLILFLIYLRLLFGLPSSK